jgi:hypothetical protein
MSKPKGWGDARVADAVLTKCEGAALTLVTNRADRRHAVAAGSIARLDAAEPAFRVVWP